MRDGDAVGTHGEFTLLDSTALVAGAAVASVHINDAVRVDNLNGAMWALAWGTFAGIALTASGTFLLMVRQIWRRPRGHPLVGEWLWGMLGVPWLLTAVVSSGPDPRRGGLYQFGLCIGLGISSLVAMATVWKTWVLVPADVSQAREATPWTDRVGMVLAVAWPLQCAFGLLVISK